MMSRSVMDLKDVCLELCAGGILIKALELVRLPNYQSLNPVEFLYECLTSEAARRQTRKVATQIKKSACFYPDACIENTLYAPDRNLNRGLIERTGQLRLDSQWRALSHHRRHRQQQDVVGQRVDECRNPSRL